VWLIVHASIYNCLICLSCLSASSVFIVTARNARMYRFCLVCPTAHTRLPIPLPLAAAGCAIQPWADSSLWGKSFFGCTNCAAWSAPWVESPPVRKSWVILVRSSFSATSSRCHRYSPSTIKAVPRTRRTWTIVIVWMCGCSRKLNDGWHD